MRKPRNCVVGFTLILCLSSGMAARKTRAPEPQCDEQVQLPRAVQTVLKQRPDVAVSCRLKPPIIQGDFDDDGHPDYAVLVTQRASQKRGFLIVFGNGRTEQAGAGRPVEYGAAAFTDLNFKQWSLRSKTRPVESAPDQPALKLHGDALLVGDTDGASGLFYWDGRRIRWYQQGD
jgi:hypothetical protein